MSKRRETPDSPPKANATSGKQLLVIVAVFAGVLLGINWIFSSSGKKGQERKTQNAATSAPTPTTFAPPGSTARQSALMNPKTGQRVRVSASGDDAPRSISLLDVTNLWSADLTVDYWFDGVPESARAGRTDTGDLSNIRPADYAGPESCKECHPGNYDDWRNHGHRKMNALATPENVLGDFSGNARIEYKGGAGTFFTEGDKFRMATQKGDLRRVYDIERTIGSRFFQYYIGKLVEGPDLDESPRREVEHVLPFGYWLDAKEWVPAVRTFRIEDADHYPFDPYAKHQFAAYDGECGNCHTTMPVGDWMIHSSGRKFLTEYTPRNVSFHFTAYLADAYPGIIPPATALNQQPDNAAPAALDALPDDYPTRDLSVTLGISCEACHYGAAEHVARSTKETSDLLPSFFPVSPHLYLKDENGGNAIGKSDLNRNFTCAKCHSGERTEYASGNHVLNSTEYADAVRGGCYDPAKAEASGMRQLTCVHCHDPHKSIGKKWTPTPRMDDDKCLQCHDDLKPEPARMAHTHHPMESSGARCMNCHMPKISEGLQDATRTHRIFSPNHAGNIEANHPNACNLCHLEKNIDWTLSKLTEWYGYDAAASEAKIAANYPQRDGAVGLGWLTGKHHATRLSAAQALLNARQGWAVPELLNQLDTDPFLINRQLTQRGLDQWLGVKLRDMGYQFYMTPPERKETIGKLRPELLARTPAEKTAQEPHTPP
jgi:predicted CXXCH cytochrome family protein